MSVTLAAAPVVSTHVRPPHGIDLVEFERLKAVEKACAQELQRGGTWVHL
jgi:muconolactone delta-isomerase